MFWQPVGQLSSKRNIRGTFVLCLFIWSGSEFKRNQDEIIDNVFWYYYVLNGVIQWDYLTLKKMEFSKSRITYHSAGLGSQKN